MKTSHSVYPQSLPPKERFSLSFCGRITQKDFGVLERKYKTEVFFCPLTWKRLTFGTDPNLDPGISPLLGGTKLDT